MNNQQFDKLIVLITNRDDKQALITFLRSLIESQLFKILPMKEDNNEHLKEHLDSMNIEMIGAGCRFKDLNSFPEYIRICNTINFFINNEFSVKQCKREVFKMIELTKHIYLYIAGEAYER